MKCWNSAFNYSQVSQVSGQGSRVIIVVVQVGAVKMKIDVLLRLQQCRRSRKMKDRWKLSLSHKLMVFWVSLPIIYKKGIFIFFGKFCFGISPFFFDQTKDIARIFDFVNNRQCGFKIFQSPRTFGYGLYFASKW